MKYRPSVTVMRRARRVSFRESSSILWWAQVTDTPEARRTAVFRRGTA